MHSRRSGRGLFQEPGADGLEYPPTPRAPPPGGSGNPTFGGGQFWAKKILHFVPKTEETPAQLQREYHTPTAHPTVSGGPNHAVPRHCQSMPTAPRNASWGAARAYPLRGPQHPLPRPAMDGRSIPHPPLFVRRTGEPPKWTAPVKALASPAGGRGFESHCVSHGRSRTGRPARAVACRSAGTWSPASERATVSSVSLRPVAFQWRVALPAFTPPRVTNLKKIDRGPHARMDPEQFRPRFQWSRPLQSGRGWGPST